MDTCPRTGKIMYATPNEAWRFARKMVHRKGTKLTGYSYFCQHCGSYHFTKGTGGESFTERQAAEAKRKKKGGS